MFVPLRLPKKSTLVVPIGFELASDMNAKTSEADGPGSCCGS